MWHKLDQYASFSIPKDSAYGFTGWGNCLPLILLGSVVWYHSMLCHIVLKSKLFSQPFPIMIIWRKLSLWWHIIAIIAAVRGKFYAEVCSLPSASEEPSVHKLPGISNFPPSSEPHSTLLHSVLPFSCHTSTFSDEIINFSFVYIGRGSPQVGWLVVSVFTSLKCLLVICTANIHAGISICTLKSRLNVKCDDFLLYKKFYLRIKMACPCQPVSSTEVWPHDGDRQCNFHSRVT
jgi:hypothetical protein